MPPKKDDADPVKEAIRLLFSGSTPKSAAVLAYRVLLAWFVFQTSNTAKESWRLLQSIPDLTTRVERIENVLKAKGFISGINSQTEISIAAEIK